MAMTLLIVGAAIVMSRGYIFRAHGPSWSVVLEPAVTATPAGRPSMGAP
jgi:hypothetical protein